MEAAAPKTYISKRMMSQYVEQRRLRQADKQKVKKAFAEDEEEKKMDLEMAGSAQAQAMAQPSAASAAEPKKKGLLSCLFSFGGGGGGGGSARESSAPQRELEMDRNLSCEEMDSDDLSGELNLSDCEDGARVRASRKKQKAVKRSRKNKAANVYRIENDSNVFQVKMDCLANQAELATGDAEFCPHCGAVFNKASVLTEENGQQMWRCEFCNHVNEVMIDEAEIPASLEMTYLLEAAAQVQDAKAGGKANKDISVVFCLDISGSMCVTQAIQGKHALKGDRLRALQDQMRQFGDGSDQFMNAADRGKTYVSRIQCVKAAIDSQINDMANGAENRKIGIVTFNHEITVIGDGSKQPMTIAGDHLSNFETLQNNGKAQAAERLTKPVSATKDSLKQKLDAVEETGPTALGPGILTSVAMAAEGSAGSSVVICTDGLANIGLGAFDECVTEEDTRAAEEFYERVGQIAQAAGVTINIISIEGDECNLDSLSKLAELTGGNVERVNPTTLTQDFANMLSMPVIATQVEAKVKLHKGLQFRNELDQDLAQEKTLLARHFGNVTEETIFTFEYGMKPISQLLEMEDIDMSSITHFPFQTQIKYTALDGSKMLRVISKKMEVSQEREELRAVANNQMLNKNTIMKGTQMARAGNIKQAQALLKGFKRAQQKNISNESAFVQQQQYNEQVQDVYGMMNDAVASDDEAEAMEECMMQAPAMNSAAMPQPRGMMMSAAPRQEMMMMSSAAAPTQKSKAAKSSMFSLGGKKKNNDEFSAKLYKMSKK